MNTGTLGLVTTIFLVLYVAVVCSFPFAAFALIEDSPLRVPFPPVLVWTLHSLYVYSFSGYLAIFNSIKLFPFY